MKCFYHASDSDGWCSGAIVALSENNYENENFIGIDYSNNNFNNFDFSKISRNETVYIVDLSFTEDTLNILSKIISKCGIENIIWLDHHKSSIDICNKYPTVDSIRGVRSSDHSAAYLTWIYLFGTEYIPAIVEYISDYDSFVFKYGDASKFLNYGVNKNKLLKNPASLLWSTILKSDNFVVKLISDGKIIDAYLSENYSEYIKNNAYETNFEGYTMAVVNRNCNSLIFGDLYKRYKIVSTFVYDGEKWKYSLYSGDPSVDCEAIARKYGGGGHKGAAGFSSDEMLYKKTSSIDLNY